MYRVEYRIGKVWWQCDYGTFDQAKARVNELLKVGFCRQLKSGVQVVYPPHRIHEIKVRPNKKKIAAARAAAQEASRRQAMAGVN